jgi:O-antigen ligase
MNLIEKTLKNKHTKNILLFILLVLFGSSIAKGLIAIAGGFTLGSLMRTFLPALPCLFLVIVIFMTDFSSLSLPTLRFERPDIRIKQVFLILCIVLPIIPLVSYAGTIISMTINLIIIFIIAGFLISLFVSIKYGFFYGIIGFLLTYPFLTFIQWELGNFFLRDSLCFHLGPLVLNPIIIYLLVLFFVFLQKRFTKEKTWANIPLYKTIGIYLFVFFISVITSENVEHSFKTYLLEIIYPILFFFIIINNIKTDKEIRLIIYALIVSAILFSFFDYYFLIRRSMVDISNITAMHGIYFFGWVREMFLLLTLPLTLSLAATSSKGKGLIILGALIMIAFLLFSQSRVVVIAMFASLSVFFKNRRIMIMILSLSILAIIFWDWALHNIFIRFQEFTSIESLHPLNWSPMRYYGWVAAIDMIKDYPLHGIGLGMWGSYYYKYGPSFTWNIPGYGVVRVWIAGAHNAFLDVATETGIPGLIVWLLLFGTIFKEGLYVLRNSVNKTRKSLALGCISSMIAFWVICLGGGYPSVSADRRFGVGIAFWTMVCIIFAIKRLEINKESKKF